MGQVAFASNAAREGVLLETIPQPPNGRSIEPGLGALSCIGLAVGLRTISVQSFGTCSEDVLAPRQQIGARLTVTDPFAPPTRGLIFQDPRKKWPDSELGSRSAKAQ